MALESKPCITSADTWLVNYENEAEDYSEYQSKTKEKINEKVQEMEKDGYQIKTMSFWGTDKVVIIFKKGLKGSLL